jgi:hypothetical protein
MRLAPLPLADAAFRVMLRSWCLCQRITILVAHQYTGRLSRLLTQSLNLRVLYFAQSAQSADLR